MKIIDRYIAVTLFKTTSVALVTLLSFFVFITLIDQLGDTGRGNYDIGKAIEYVLLTIPRLAYELIPVCAIIGSMSCLGLLSYKSELVIIRSSGVSLQRLVISLIKAGIIIVLITLFIGEFIAPYCEKSAQQLRSVATSNQISLNTKNGFWSRDGQSFINIRKITSPGMLEQIYLYEFDENGKLRVSTYASRAKYENKQWILEDIHQSVINTDTVTTKQLKLAEWKSLLSPDMLNFVTIKPQYLTIPGLIEYISYLNSNNQNSQQYEQALWSKIIYPVTIISLIVLAIPLVDSRSRTIPVSQQVFIGCLMGITFHVLNQVAGQMGIVYSLNPFLSSTVPTFIIFFIILSFIYRKSNSQES